ncbi:plasmid pRiA4b ORF-3 family protein [Tenacibaculum dicentrarchi]|nr:plasmid pRiA4b ORF-3 family protein [Tenacibaculum dicentrarchi]MCD8419711.1 plasmid pRiA4b ORF-3 family protein [Tenacibaculum dicentrarchi]MCD8437278.1 plasmid pRiA4b ORF-3 family protein [Tenacibaculum dicentrarchi]MCD8451963.1 plasmid pRiA4b ORF-3 family protein [Tenacibaculum dicentrarchi]MCG8827798.1 plasmid pRiA4b ORF-3 family protein [Tenacibaculum dicentrarchi]
MYKVRVILDTKKDVIRTLVVNQAKSLEDLHSDIAKSFGFNGQEMASFYRTDEDWNQGEEIPLFDMSEDGSEPSMSTCVIKETLPSINDKLIYVYDFLQMWTFYVEVVEQSDEVVTDTKIILTVGEIPDEAPQKEFIATEEEGDLDDEFDAEFNDGFTSFENIDDFDFDNF